MAIKNNQQIDYLYKRSKYIFPIGTKIFFIDNKPIIEINNKREKNISKYLSSKLNNKDQYKYKIGLPITVNGSNLLTDYQLITDYLLKNIKFDFLHFDYATSHQLALCTFFGSINSGQTERIINEINESMPYLINIFKQPLIHLKEIDMILPVDTVRYIDHNTLSHLSMHAEHIEGAMSTKIVPLKLLTKVYTDDYGIYENIIFRDLIDKLLSFLRKIIYNLTVIFDAFNENIHLDAINRINHPKYFLAIGKLYLGFTKVENSTEILTILESAKNLYMQLNKYKTRAVYTKNSKIKPISGEIKKTNILMFHKYYKHVYSLYQKFNMATFEQQNIDPSLQDSSQASYEQFCQMLVLFAVSNFNMTCKPDNIIFENGKTNAFFEYKDWSLKMTSEYNEILDFNIIILNVSHKTKAIKFLLIPMSYYISQDKKNQYEYIIKRLFYDGNNYDKYVFLEPFSFNDNSLNNYSIKYSLENIDLFYAILPISISEINSFRRIQKLIFECMVITNNNYDLCAFCGEKLIMKSNNKYLCHKCKTAIKIIHCEQCKDNFIATYMDTMNKKKNYKQEEDFFKNMSNFYKQEKQYLFRDIVKIKDNYFICPYCNKENINK